ncbi:hypothetical protein [Paraliomyxa miuraensis]|uniref:hypothetical protein n=1 Tax=Paraliomyxa miuraensis TaxID=376150 RepID=UPI002259B17B|nr:hypothetical protein [Paraliomyxa miuraensis]MCX4242993.1 hypothetical protein [Paraliomyxa miuraensis]
MLIDYRRIQSPATLRKLETRNFVGEMGKMQWWYVDVLMDDGSVLMIAVVPKKWWPDQEGADLDDAFVMVSLMRAEQGDVLSVSRTIDTANARGTESPLSYELPDAVRIVRNDDGYSFFFELEEVRGRVDLRSRTDVFSAFPRGTLPSWARAFLLGGGGGREPFSYVTYVPRGEASGQLTLRGEEVSVCGAAYHEQGRFMDPAHALSRGWFWCHFLHPEWNVFGSPGMFLYVQRGTDEPVFRGFNLLGKRFELENRRSTRVPRHPKVYCGGDMRFQRGKYTLSIHAEPDGQVPMLSFPSATTRQIYHTLVTDAQLLIEGPSGRERVDGRMIFETCWLVA